MRREASVCGERGRFDDNPKHKSPCVFCMVIIAGGVAGAGVPAVLGGPSPGAKAGGCRNA